MSHEAMIQMCHCNRDVLHKFGIINGFHLCHHEGGERAAARGRGGEEPRGGEGAEDEDRDQEGGAAEGEANV